MGLLAGTLMTGCTREDYLPINQDSYKTQEQRIELNVQNELKRKVEEEKRKLEEECTFEKRLIRLNDNQTKVISEFNQYISDGRLTLNEQKILQNKIKNLERTRINLAYNAPAKYSTLRQKCGNNGYYTEGKIKDVRLLNNPLYSLESSLYKNLRGIDLGTPKLEKQLEKQKISCEVDSKISFLELLTGLSLGFLGTYLLFKEKNKSKNEDYK